MPDWTAGYVADIGYTFGYYTELNPLRVQLAFLNNGLVCPEFGTACELGFGQGVSTNIHAAGTVIQWNGTDFNPSQAAHAQELATVAASGAKLFDQAFVDFAVRSDLPDFDYIGLHGIWSWISDDNRAVIVDFIRHKLKVGGVLYISYNNQPGWAVMLPMRDLLTAHSKVMVASGQDTGHRIDAALLFAEKLLTTNPTYAKVNPQIAEWVKKIKEQPHNYVAHEYFNRDWKPMSFTEMCRWLEPAKLGFACSANYLDHVDALNLTEDQLGLLKGIPDDMFRQTVRDFIVNQQFRKDYWVRGKRKLNELEKAEGLRAVKVMLTTIRADVSLKVNCYLGEAIMQEAVYNPILDVLADNKPKTLGQIEQALKDKTITLAQITQAVLILNGVGHVTAVQEDDLVAKARKHTDKLNAHIINRARGSGELTYLASPVTGGGIAVERIPQLFLLAISKGKKHPTEWAQVAWQILALQDQKIVKDGKALETAEENLEELTSQAKTFEFKQLPALKMLQIV